MYLEAQSWADLRRVQASNLPNNSGLSGVIESPEIVKNAFLPLNMMLALLYRDGFLETAVISLYTAGPHLIEWASLLAEWRLEIYKNGVIDSHK